MCSLTGVVAFRRQAGISKCICQLIRGGGNCRLTMWRTLKSCLTIWDSFGFFFKKIMSHKEHLLISDCPTWHFFSSYFFCICQFKSLKTYVFRFLWASLWSFPLVVLEKSSSQNIYCWAFGKLHVHKKQIYCWQKLSRLLPYVFDIYVSLSLFWQSNLESQCSQLDSIA